MDIIKVNVEDLLKHVRENQTKHDKILKAAIKGYWKQCRVRLYDALRSVKDKQPNWQNTLFDVRTAPEDHSDDYNSAICMLEMCAEPIIEISRQDFEAYVMNKWHWRSTFIATSVAYGVTGPTGPTGPCGDGGPSGLDF